MRKQIDIKSPKGDIYRIIGGKGEYEILLWNAHFRAWIDGYRPKFRRLKDAIRRAKEEIEIDSSFLPADRA
jgi:hypothetical protein